MRSFINFLLILTLVSLTFAEVESTGASDALNKFSVELLSEVVKEKANEANVVIGPYTVWVALSILNEGAKGNTANELTKTLRIPQHDSQRQEFRGQQRNIVNNISQSSDGIVLDAVNDIFARREARINTGYQDLVNNTYGVTVGLLDFKANPVEAAYIINKKISDATRGRIPSIVDAGSVSGATMYITSALYFKGLWSLPFKTVDDKKPFYDERGKILNNVPMMTITEDYNYGEILNGKATAVQLPYQGERLSMIVVLPKEDPLSSVIDTIAKTPFNEILGDLHYVTDVEVTMPKFKVTTDVGLNSALKTMGIHDVFTEKANLQVMSPDPLSVSTVSHKAEIEVDEKGTVGAAVSSIKIVTLSFHYPTAFNVNKPFLYFVYDKGTETILFMGKVSDPKSA